MNKKREVACFLFDDLLLLASEIDEPKETGRAKYLPLHAIPLRSMSVTDLSGLDGGKSQTLTLI